MNVMEAAVIGKRLSVQFRANTGFHSAISAQ